MGLPHAWYPASDVMVDAPNGRIQRFCAEEAHLACSPDANGRPGPSTDQLEDPGGRSSRGVDGPPRPGERSGQERYWREATLLRRTCCHWAKPAWSSLPSMNATTQPTVSTATCARSTPLLRYVRSTLPGDRTGPKRRGESM